MAIDFLTYLDKIKDLFKDDINYLNCVKAIDKGNNPTFQISQKFKKKVFETDWVEAIEDTLPAIDAIVRNPRRFITVEEDVIDVSLAKQISRESVKHLSQHTQFIQDVDPVEETVIPSRILNTLKEESFEVYENRFLYTLIKRLDQFIAKRYDLIKRSLINNKNEVSIIAKSDYDYLGSNIKVKMETHTEIPYDEDTIDSSSDDYNSIERVKRISQIVQGFLHSAFAKEMKNSAPVRSPITRTNVIKKEPNFKKALVLWLYIESYDKTGFETKEVEETRVLPEILDEQYHQMAFINDLIIRNFANIQEGGKTIDEVEDKMDEIIKDKELEDFLTDFPSITLDLKEVRKVYYKTNGDKIYSPNEYRELTSALDRVINQYQINKAKKDDALKKKLIAKQKKEDARVKKMIEREKKLEEARRKKKAQEEIKALENQQKEMIRNEKRKALEEKRLLKEQQEKEMAKLLEEQELDKKIEEYKKNLEKKLQKDLSKFEIEEENLVNQEMNDFDSNYQSEIDKFKEDQIELFKKMLDEKLNPTSKQNYEEVKN